MNECLFLTYKQNIEIIIIFFLPVEIATLTRENDKTKIRILPADELEVLIKEHEEKEAAIEAEKKKKEEKQKKWELFNLLLVWITFCMYRMGFGSLFQKLRPLQWYVHVTCRYEPMIDQEK